MSIQTDSIVGTTSSTPDQVDQVNHDSIDIPADVQVDVQDDVHNDAPVDVPERADDQTDDQTEDQTEEQIDEHIDTPDVDPELEGQETTVKTDDRPVFTWNGQRPFAGAVAQYEEILTSALAEAEEKLNQNKSWAYAHVDLPLFSTIKVECTDQFGNKEDKVYAFHEAHYGPVIRQQFPAYIPPHHRKWVGFYNRFHGIWPLLNRPGKLPGGDGSGIGGTACSPFRDAQMTLLQKGLYLIDASDVVFDQNKGQFWYKINIAVYRSPPRNGPFRMAHGYGFIPGLGPAVHTQQQATVQTTNGTNGAIGHSESSMPRVKKVRKSIQKGQKNQRGNKNQSNKQQAQPRKRTTAKTSGWGDE